MRMIRTHGRTQSNRGYLSVAMLSSAERGGLTLQLQPIVNLSRLLINHLSAAINPSVWYTMPQNSA